MQRILMTLSSVFVFLVTGVAVSDAAYLNDIRVGEYHTHTRIVFELSETTPFERVVSQKAGELTIIFANTQPMFVRKIPLERTKRVQNIKLLRRQDSLVTTLMFSFDHFRYELNEFQKPFRLAIDVYHLTSKPQDGASSETVSEQITAPVARQTPDHPSALPDEAQPSKPLPSDKTTDVPSADQDPTAPPHPPLAPPDKPAVEQSSLPPAAPTKGPLVPETTASHAKGMQYYLVVGMVIMTIIILILLLLMIIFKQPKFDTKSSSAGDDLRQQDKRIAALNDQIHEQLKRYDDA